jgi:hypothetical protein
MSNLKKKFFENFPVQKKFKKKMQATAVPGISDKAF